MARDPAGRIVLPVLGGPARGLRLRLDVDGRLVDSNYVLGTYDRHVTHFLARMCRPGWTAWDCGSYLGFYTVLLARLVGPSGHVVAFEPDSRNLARTRENVEMNRFTNVEYVAAAVGGITGEVEFILSNDSNSHISGTWIGRSPQDYAGRERDGGHQRVTCLRLDDAVQGAGLPVPHLIKMDIEGAETHALDGAIHLARHARPIIALELHNPDSELAAWRFAHSAGYILQAPSDGRALTALADLSGLPAVLCLPVS